MPRFIEIGELVTHGYKDEVVLPIEVSATDPARPTALHAVVNYLACEQICVPFTAELTLELPPGPAGPSVFGGLIADYQARVPGPPRAEDRVWAPSRQRPGLAPPAAVQSVSGHRPGARAPA